MEERVKNVFRKVSKISASRVMQALKGLGLLCTRVRTRVIVSVRHDIISPTRSVPKPSSQRIEPYNNMRDSIDKMCEDQDRAEHPLPHSPHF